MNQFKVGDIFTTADEEGESSDVNPNTPYQVHGVDRDMIMFNDSVGYPRRRFYAHYKKLHLETELERIIWGVK